MPLRRHAVTVAAIAAAGLLGAAQAHAQAGMSLRPIPAAECQALAAQTQQAAGIRTTASEDDFTDLTSNTDGRSCHIAGSASNLGVANPAELIGQLAKIFPGWTSEAARDAEGPSGGEKGYVNGNRIATIEVSWEPGPGASCSDKESLSACNISPQQKLWNVVIDVVERGAR